MRAAERRTTGVFNSGQKRQRSPNDETERKIKVLRITSNSGGECRVVEIGNIIQPRKKPKPRGRPLSNTYQPNRAEALIFNARRTLNSNFKTLKEEMDALQVVRILKENGILDEDFYKKFKEKRIRQEKVETLLIELDRILTEGDDVRKLQIFPGFVKALEESDQDELVTALRTPPQGQEFKCTATDVNDMYRFFHNAKDKIIETIEPRRFIDDVVTIHGIDLQEYEHITSKSEREERARELLLTIKTAQSPFKIMKPMCDCYGDLYSEFKNSEKSETASVNEIGTRVAVKYNFPETVAQEDKNEHSHPISEIKKLQKRLVDTTNDNPEQFERLHEEISNDARLLLSRLSLGSVKFHLRTTSTTSLEDLKKCCRNGRSIAWLMSLLKPDDIEKLKELEATNGKLECYIDDEDPKKQLFDEAFEDCFCVLNKDTLQSNICLFQEDLGSLEMAIIDIMLDSKTLDVTLAKSLSHVKANAAKLGTKHVLTKFLQDEAVPKICFCIIERELMRSMKCATIQQLQGKILDCSGLRSKNLTTVVKENLKENTDLVEEETDARWFLPTLKSRTEKKYVKIVKEIENARSRKSRTKPFVQFLCEEEDVEWFVKELEEFSPHVLAVLSHQKNLTEATVFRNAMLSVYDFIINEVEPLELKSHLRASCMEQLQFSDMEKISGRRERAFFLMKQVFGNKNLDRVLDVMDAFSSKYTNIEKAIKDVSRNGSMCEHYKCPRIEKHHMKMTKYIFTADFTLKGLEQTDAGLVMQPSKCQLLKLDIFQHELSSNENLVVVSNDEDIRKDLHIKENACIPSEAQAVEASGGSCCEIQTTAKTAIEIPDECSSEVPVPSETKHMSYEDIHTSKAGNGNDKEQKQREMRIKAEKGKEENVNIMNATPKEITFYKLKGQNKMEENMKKSELEVDNDEMKQTIVEPLPALASIQSYQKQLPNERPPLVYDKEYGNEHIEEPLKIIVRETCSVTSNEQSLQNKLTNEPSTNIPMETKMKPMTSEMSKVQNDQFAVDKLPLCQDIKLQDRSLKQIINTAADLEDIETEVINNAKTLQALDQIVNKCSRSATSDSLRSGDCCQESAIGSQSNKNVASSAPIITTKNTTEAVAGSKAESMSVHPKPFAPRRKFRLSPKAFINRKSREFHSVRHYKPVSCGNEYQHQRRFENFGQQNSYMEYYKDIERRRWQHEESWNWYAYNEWLGRIQMTQSFWPQNTWLKSNPHNRSYSHPPMRRQPHHYEDFNGREMIWF